MTPADQTSSLADRLAGVRQGISEALRRAGRDGEDVTLIVVTKFHPASLVRELHALGVTDVGESRHQEAKQKSAELSDLDLGWHFVGQLQSKKARQVADYAKVIHSLDRESVVEALTDRTPPTDGFLQVNLTGDPDRGGVDPAGVERMTERISAAGGIRLLGVMAVAPLSEPPRAAFARLREISDRVRRIEPGARFISAGMSGDFADAIAEGATHLRIGTAITGNRPQGG